MSDITNLKRWFLLDGIGAFISCIMLSFVLVQLQHLIGMPVSKLYFLAAFPFVYTLFDAYNYYKLPNAAPRNLRLVAMLNVLYCIISAVLLVMHFADLKTLGWIYFISEKIIVLILANMEWKAAVRY